MTKSTIITLLALAAPFTTQAAIVDGTVDLAFYANCLGQTIEAECDIEIDDRRRQRQRQLKQTNLRQGRSHQQEQRRLPDEAFFLAFQDCDVKTNGFSLFEGIVNFQNIEFQESADDENGESEDVDVITRSINSELLLTDDASGKVVAKGVKNIQVTIREDPDNGDEFVDRIEFLSVVWEQSPNCEEQRTIDLNNDSKFIDISSGSSSRSRK